MPVFVWKLKNRNQYYITKSFSLGRAFNSVIGFMNTMLLCLYEATQLNLKLKTQYDQLLGSLSLDLLSTYHHVSSCYAKISGVFFTFEHLRLTLIIRLDESSCKYCTLKDVWALCSTNRSSNWVHKTRIRPIQKRRPLWMGQSWVLWTQLLDLFVEQSAQISYKIIVLGWKLLPKWKITNRNLERIWARVGGSFSWTDQGKGFKVKSEVADVWNWKKVLRSLSNWYLNFDFCYLFMVIKILFSTANFKSYTQAAQLRQLS